MVNLFNYNDRLVSMFIEEFVEAKCSNSRFIFTCVYKSADFPEERQVFLIEIEGQRFALKLDLTSHKTDRLENEFDVLNRLQLHFEQHKRVSVIKPIYFSPSGKFFVTEYVGRKTATEAIRELEQDNRAGQIYRRSGEWLNVLHSFTEATHERFWYQWMFENLTSIISSSTPQALAEEYEPMIEQLHRDAIKIDGVSDLKVFSSGDFHGRNLIIDSGHVYGLDFTESKEKLAVYDIVDFLKIDVFRQGKSSDIDRSGILKYNKKMFFKLYRHPINMDVLDFSIRARLLIDWMSITRERYSKTKFQRTKFEKFRERLLITFQTGL
ncbi:aminoglycoside phosphotransferase family protein [Tritonibacter mobilis]|uniref:aminoglycoside phosphotransferase family protein n=1 Tax=Tritonibacter mobilis TaxID=379347 RepID=UPI000F7E614F|nr:aminoglycoside phosphotransferase family protein [Tritonibacter mobilis]